MAFNTSISANQLTAILTPEGKRALANGEFNIKYAAFMDGCIDYNLANSADGDAAILSTPIPEPSGEGFALANTSFLITLSDGSFVDGATLTLVDTPNTGIESNPINIIYDVRTGVRAETSEFKFTNNVSNSKTMVTMAANKYISANSNGSDTMKFKLSYSPTNVDSNKVFSVTFTDDATGATLILWFKIILQVGSVVVVS